MASLDRATISTGSAAAEELGLASRRADGTLRGFVTMWVVRVGDDVYVRSAHGPDNPWYRRAIASGPAGSVPAVSSATSPSTTPTPARTRRSMPPTTPSTTATDPRSSAPSSAPPPTDVTIRLVPRSGGSQHDLSNISVVVIGAGSIGQAIARRVSAGKHVVLADLRIENAEAAAEVFRDAGFDVTTATVDVSARDVGPRPRRDRHRRSATSPV